MAKGIQITRIALELGIDNKNIEILYDFLNNPKRLKTRSIARKAIGTPILRQALQQYSSTRGLVKAA